VRAYSADLYRFAFWLCRDRHMAEDVVQEACLRAWNAWDSLHEPERAKAWMMTIVRNEYARSCAKRSRETSLDDLDEGALSWSSPSAPGFDAGRLVARLPQAYREPLLLQVLGGFTCGEIAGMLGTTEGAVTTRLTRARQALRQQLREPDERKASR
jgi:RNA polymerase sigma-70 factor (ECF subfamily)